jgi:hypothetical protein
MERAGRTPVTDTMHDETPGTILDRLRDDRGLSADEREGWLNRLIERFSSSELLDALASRLGDLSGGDAEAILRLVEAYGSESVYRDLAASLVAQPDLPAERAWEALSLLDAAGIIEDEPSLLERWDDLNEAIDGDASLEALALQLEEEADGPWLALQGLSAVEHEVRVEIIAGLADLPGGPGLVEFLRLLSFAHDPSTRWAALDALAERPLDDPAVLAAWRSIAQTHPDPGVAESAQEKLEGREGTTLAVSEDRTVVVRSLVTAVDGEGRATIVLAAREGDRWAGAAFLCHVLRGIVDVVGQDGIGDQGLDAAFEALNEQSACEVVENAPVLAARLLAGSLSLCGPQTTPALRYWIERTAGPSFRARLDTGLFGDWDPSTIPYDEMGERARAVLAACPAWADTSDVTLDLAREIALREAGLEPDPKRDAGAYRFLFEHRFAARIEIYQRMLLWMAAIWHAADKSELGQSALALAWQLSDPQHAVPSHPFFVALATLSLDAAST